MAFFAIVLIGLSICFVLTMTPNPRKHLINSTVGDELRRRFIPKRKGRKETLIIDATTQHTLHLLAPSLVKTKFVNYFENKANSGFDS